MSNNYFNSYSNNNSKDTSSLAVENTNTVNSFYSNQGTSQDTSQESTQDTSIPVSIGPPSAPEISSAATATKKASKAVAQVSPDSRAFRRHHHQQQQQQKHHQHQNQQHRQHHSKETSGAIQSAVSRDSIEERSHFHPHSNQPNQSHQPHHSYRRAHPNSKDYPHSKGHTRNYSSGSTGSSALSSSLLSPTGKYQNHFSGPFLNSPVRTLKRVRLSNDISIRQFEQEASKLDIPDTPINTSIDTPVDTPTGNNSKLLVASSPSRASPFLSMTPSQEKAVREVRLKAHYQPQNPYYSPYRRNYPTSKPPPLPIPQFQQPRSNMPHTRSKSAVTETGPSSSSSNATVSVNASVKNPPSNDNSSSHTKKGDAPQVNVIENDMNAVECVLHQNSPGEEDSSSDKNMNATTAKYSTPPRRQGPPGTSPAKNNTPKTQTPNARPLKPVAYRLPNSKPDLSPNPYQYPPTTNTTNAHHRHPNDPPGPPPQPPLIHQPPHARHPDESVNVISPATHMSAGKSNGSSTTKHNAAASSIATGSSHKGYTHGRSNSYNMFEQWSTTPAGTAPDAPYASAPPPYYHPGPGAGPGSYSPPPHSPYSSAVGSSSAGPPPTSQGHFQYPPSSPLKRVPTTPTASGSEFYITGRGGPPTPHYALSPFTYPPSPYASSQGPGPSHNYGHGSVGAEYYPSGDYRGPNDKYKRGGGAQPGNIAEEEAKMKHLPVKPDVPLDAGGHHMPSYRYSGGGAGTNASSGAGGSYPPPPPTTSESFDTEQHHQPHHQQHQHQYPHSYPGRDGQGMPPYPPKGPSAPPVLKASSYPPPPSPRSGRYDPDLAANPHGPSSSSSYHGPYQDGGHPEYYPPPPPHHHSNNSGAPQAHYRGDFYPPGAAASGTGEAPPYPNPNYEDYNASAGPMPPPDYHYRGPPGGYGPPPEYHPDYYRHRGHPPPYHEEAHPLLKDYDPAKDHHRVGDEYSPSDSPQSSRKSLEQSNFSTPDRKGITDNRNINSSQSSLGTPNTNPLSPPKRKPSAAAKLAIAAGMTQPASASEIDFDIHNPPLEPILPPSVEPVCTIPSNVNAHDVLCGRGGGTNTQIGNRRFRALVQEFQPTYLLCRRKEKPLIARTIVLIIRNRGGRFLKKDESTGMYFEVGDEKAEAKTSQALREGLDVRATKSTTLVGKKKNRKKGKTSNFDDAVGTEQTLDNSNEEHPSPSSASDIVMTDATPGRREGPPQPQDPYYRDSYYYGSGYEDPPYYYGYEQQQPPNTPSPSRKRQRGQHPLSHQPYYTPSHKGQPHSYPPHEYYGSHPVPPSGVSTAMSTEEDNSMWAMEFSPPRTRAKKENEDENHLDAIKASGHGREQGSSNSAIPHGQFQDMRDAPRQNMQPQNEGSARNGVSDVSMAMGRGQEQGQWTTNV